MAVVWLKRSVYKYCNNLVRFRRFELVVSRTSSKKDNDVRKLFVLIIVSMGRKPENN